MASRIFGSTAARLRFLRPTTIASASAKSVSGGFAAWKILAAASSSYAVGSVCSDNATVETAETTETETVTETTRARATAGERTGRDDGRANVSAIPHLYRQWKATILPMVTTTTMMMTTVCEANDVPEAEVEAALKSSMIASKEESNERREQRHKFLQKSQAINTNDNAKPKPIRRRMTNVGRFSLVSETAQNPSVPVLVLAMTGHPYFAKDFCRLYQERKVSEMHPRFGARLDATKTHFVFDNGGGDDQSNNGNKNRGVSTASKDNVRDVMFPTIPTAELKDRVNDASLYEPLDLNSRLWEAWTATGGALGQSGAISSTPRKIEKSQGATTGGDETNVESLLLFRAHHCMADGVSLATLFIDLMDEGPEIQAKIQEQIEIFKKKKRTTPWWKKLLFVLYYWIWGSMKALWYQAYLFAISWYDQFKDDDPWMILKAIYDERRLTIKNNGQHQTIPPRSLAWQTIAPVDEVKRVAKFYTKANRAHTGQKSKVTINDVFCSCVSAAIVKQLEYHRVVNPKLSSSGQRLSLPSMNLIIPVHLQGGILLPGQSMGNKIGAMVSRIPGEHILGSKNIDSNDRAVSAQERLIQVHSVLNARKQTPIAVLSFLMAGVMGYLSPSSSSSSSLGDDAATGYAVGSSPSSWTPWIFRKAHANASVVVSNVRGAENTVHIEGRPIRAFLGFLPLPGGVPVGLVVGSYENKITLTVTAEEYAVPDADQFLTWVRDEYELLKQRADEAEGTTT